MELYGLRGYEQTTVAEIAKRAGVTERTFFRHFADKREVLFSASEALRDNMLAGLDAAPPAASALEAVQVAIERLSEAFTGREYSRLRQGIIDANPELRERELIKLSSYASALEAALRRSGFAEPTARLAAEMGIAAFRLAWELWLSAAQDRSLVEFIRESFEQLKSVTISRV
jgi:AcrR family transcriptional regulator